MSDMRLLSVVPMSEFREPKIKVCKVDVKMLLENFCGGPPSCTAPQMRIMSVPCTPQTSLSA